VIGGENSRKPVFGFWLLGEKEFCKGLNFSDDLLCFALSAKPPVTRSVGSTHG